MAMSVGSKGPKKVMAEINITPFTDVCLVLLIIFMVSASFLGAQRGLDVKLPSPSNDKQVDTRPTGDITLLVRANGAVQMTVTRPGGAPAISKDTSPDQLVNDLSDAATRYKIQSVTIRTEHSVVYRSVVQVIDSVKLAGINYMALAVEEKAIGPGGAEAAGATAPGSANAVNAQGALTHA